MSTLYGTYMTGQNKDQKQNFAYKIVQYAQEHGIKPAVRHFSVSRNTVKAYLSRYKEGGFENLRDRRNGPKNPHLKMSKKEEEEIIESRKQCPYAGARRLKCQFELKRSCGAINRVLKQNGLTKPRKKKHRTRNDLREEKEKIRSLTKLQIDIKYLNDIPNYHLAYKLRGVPRFQYTVRDVKSGMLFLGYANEISELNARSMMFYVLRHLQEAIGEKNMPSVIVQSDNGVEFSGTAKDRKNATFVRAIVDTFNVQHWFIPPRKCNYNAEVESSHRIIEDEFYDIEDFMNRQHFMEKVTTYQFGFNTMRINFYKNSRTPWEIAQNDWPGTDVASYMAKNVVPIDLDSVDFARGQTLPSLVVKNRTS